MNAAFSLLLSGLALNAFNPPSSDPRPVGSVELAKISAAQERGFAAYSAGKSSIDFSCAVGPQYEIWAKLRQGAALKHYAPGPLREGLEVSLPLESYRLKLNQGVLDAAPLNDSGPAAAVHYRELVKNLHAAAGHAVFSEDVRYALLYENNPDMPRAISMIRRDREDIYWLSYIPWEELGDYYWFLAINGTMYGMRAENERLAFYAKPVPDILPKYFSEQALNP